MNQAGAFAILDLIFARRRVLPDVPPLPTEAARALHLPRVLAFMEKGEPVQLVLPGFPAKAPNAAKVLGPLPDAAERIGLQFLEALMAEVRQVYAPGAQLTLCSDGHVFADVVGVSDADVTAYRSALVTMISSLGLTHLRVFSLQDACGDLTPAAARQALLHAHSITTEEVRARAAREPAHRAQLDGIHRFLFEDEVVRSPELSRTQIRKATRTRACEVVRRSDAWSQLVAATFPRALRLSIHPQPDVSPKIGISLFSMRDAWLTPWHGVAVLGGEHARLMRRHEAEALGAHVVLENGRPSHMFAAATP